MDGMGDMGLFTFSAWFIEIRKSRGQTLVEYILMLVLVALIATTWMKKFRTEWGVDSKMDKVMKAYFQYTYRHTHECLAKDVNAAGLDCSSDYDNDKTNGKHASYFLQDGNNRFKVPSQKYPQ